MKLAAFFLCILLLASCKNENEKVQDVNPMITTKSTPSAVNLYAQIGFENRVIELGKIVSFENNHVIHFTNEGDTTLVIHDVYAESDRIEIHGFTYEIKPGEQGKIRLKIDSDLDLQSYSDYIFINSNNKNTPSLARLEINYELSNDLVVGGVFVEEGDRINVRMFPALDATVIFGLEKGDQVNCIGAMRKEYVEDFDSDLWYYVSYNGRKGWILSALTDFKKEEIVAMKAF